MILRVFLCSCCIVCASLIDAETPMPTATPLTQPGSFTKGIEGPACDSDGNILVVDFERQQTIGRVTPDGKAELFVTLPGDSCGNGIRFGDDGSMFIAD